MAKSLGIVYFNREHSKLAKSIATSIRNQGHLANLVYASLFQDAKDCTHCASVAIQADSNRAAKIAGAYRQVFPETEIHFFDTEGNFVDGPEPESVSKIEMPAAVNPEGTEPNAETADEDSNATVDEVNADVPVESDAADPAPESAEADDPASEAGDDVGDAVKNP